MQSDLFIYFLKRRKFEQLHLKVGARSTSLRREGETREGERANTAVPENGPEFQFLFSSQRNKKALKTLETMTLASSSEPARSLSSPSSCPPVFIQTPGKEKRAKGCKTLFFIH